MGLNIHHPSLRLHKLSGRLSGLSSLSINMSYRITVEIIISYTDIILVDVGAREDVHR
jgi:plasmid maintenance system killer protein